MMCIFLKNTGTIQYDTFFSENFQMVKTMSFNTKVGSDSFTFAVYFLPDSIE